MLEIYFEHFQPPFFTIIISFLDLKAYCLGCLHFIVAFEFNFILLLVSFWPFEVLYSNHCFLRWLNLYLYLFILDLIRPTSKISSKTSSFA